MPRIDDSSGIPSFGAEVRADPSRRSALMQKLSSLLALEDAQTMVEYATVLTMITLACLAAFALLAAASSGAISRAAGLFP